MAIEAAAWWRAFYQFRFANWLREFVSVLSGPGAASDQFPVLDKTILDANFKSFCSEQFNRLAQPLTDREPPSYLIQARDHVLDVIEKHTGSKVGALIDPVAALEKDIVPLLQKLIVANEPTMLNLAPVGSIDHLLVEVESIGDTAPNDSRSLAIKVRRYLEQARALPRLYNSASQTQDSHHDRSSHAEEPQLVQSELSSQRGRDKQLDPCSSDIELLQHQAPLLEKKTGLWLPTLTAANEEGVEAGSLRTYKAKGQKTADGMFGRDIHGRIWRRQGTPRAHIFYLKSSLRHGG